MATRAAAGQSPLQRVALPERYEILHHIANGGMSSVWCARDELLGRTVAIKLLADGYARDAVAVRRFEREARAAARVSGHPNVATVYDIGVAPALDGADASTIGAPFIVMEYLPGGSVAVALKRAGGEGLDPELVARWLQDAAAALDYAHSLDVVHRDVKPGNLLLDDADRVRVADFGIARLMSEATITNLGEVLGTAAYLSPEQALGEPTTPASDRYSLAVTGYEMLTGTRPFEADAVLARRGADHDEPPTAASTRNPALPRAVDPVLARGMARAPQRRFESAAEFAGAIERALFVAATRPEPLRFAEAAPNTPFVSYGARRRRPPAWAGAVAAIAAVAFGVGIAAGADSSNSTTGRRLAAISQAHKLKPRVAAASVKRRRHRAKPATPRTTTSSSTVAAVAPPPPTPQQLDVRGHALMVQGDYAGAIAAMHEVLAETPPNSLLHAYALYDLGRSLRLIGDPQAAIPVLQQRLQYPDQTGVVRTELILAEKAAGLLTPPTRGKGHGPGHGDGHGAGGAAGPPQGGGGD